MSYSGFHLVNVYLHDFMKQYGRLKMPIETKCRKTDTGADGRTHKAL